MVYLLAVVLIAFSAASNSDAVLCVIDFTFVPPQGTPSMTFNICHLRHHADRGIGNLYVWNTGDAMIGSAQHWNSRPTLNMREYAVSLDLPRPAHAAGVMSASSAVESGNNMSSRTLSIGAEYLRPGEGYGRVSNIADVYAWKLAVSPWF
jgi:hypothetical protein